MKKFTFREMLTKRGCFAGITFSVSFKEDGISRDALIDYHGDERWELACRSGISLFRGYFHKDGMLEVTIHEIEWLPVDTEFLTVMYATVKALSIELDYEIPHLSLDRNNEVFIFPEPRLQMLRR